jgi:uncharacterized protein (TIGR03067 family)
MIVGPTCYNILIHNKIRDFSGLLRLSSRHVVTYCWITIYGVFSVYAGYPADMRNIDSSMVLWHKCSSDYPADMRNSFLHNQMWPSRLFRRRPRACAPPLGSRFQWRGTRTMHLSGLIRFPAVNPSLYRRHRIDAPAGSASRRAINCGTAVAMKISNGLRKRDDHTDGDTPMLALKTTFTLGLISVLYSLAVAQQTEPVGSKSDKTCTPESLVGRDDIVGGEKEGVKEPDERIKGTTVTFSKDTVIVADKDKKEIYAASYKLNATANPCDITMTSRVEKSGGEIARGLIQKEGDTVRLIYALPTGEIPASFKTKEKQLMFIMKKTE